MDYVVQQPHSNTNPSDSYRVVDYAKWNAYRNGDTQYLPVEGEFPSYELALNLRDELNNRQDER